MSSNVLAKGRISPDMLMRPVMLRLEPFFGWHFSRWDRMKEPLGFQLILWWCRSSTDDENEKQLFGLKNWEVWWLDGWISRILDRIRLVSIISLLFFLHFSTFPHNSLVNIVIFSSKNNIFDIFNEYSYKLWHFLYQKWYFRSTKWNFLVFFL